MTGPGTAREGVAVVAGMAAGATAGAALVAAVGAAVGAAVAADLASAAILLLRPFSKGQQVCK